MQQHARTRHTIALTAALNGSNRQTVKTSYDKSAAALDAFERPALGPHHGLHVAGLDG